MNTRLVRVMILMLVAASLTSLTGLIGCAKEGGENQVIVGFLGDFTGASAQTCIEINKGMMDYQATMEEEDPIPGVRIKVVTYDTRVDYGRVKPGYIWLKGQGSDIILDYNPMYVPILREDHQRDKIPSFCFSATRDTMGEDYIYGFSVDYTTEGEAIAQWLIQDWETQGKTRPMKVGYVGLLGLQSNPEVGDALVKARDVTYPGKMTLELQAGPMGSTSWATEIGRLIDSDVIVVHLFGPSMSSFLNEALARGYEGKFIGTTISFMGFWNLVRQTPGLLEKADGVRALQAQIIWSDQTTFMDDVREALEKHRREEATQLKGSTNYPSGFLFMKIFVDVIRRAAAEVGPANVDGVALNESMKTIHMDVDGFGETFQVHSGANVLHRMFRPIEFRYSGDDWFPLGDWFLPASMQ